MQDKRVRSLNGWRAVILRPGQDVGKRDSGGESPVPIEDNLCEMPWKMGGDVIPAAN